MTRVFFSLFFLLLGNLLLASPAERLTYKVSPIEKEGRLSLSIEMTFRGNASGRTKLAIPFETGLYRPQDHFTIINISNCQRHQLVPGDSGLYLLEHKPNAQLKLTYVISNALRDSLPVTDEYYAQMVTRNYVYILGNSLWVVPVDRSDAMYDIEVVWKGFPRHWTFLNSHGANVASQKFRLTTGDFHNAIYMAGDIRIHRLLINDRPVYFAIRGQWSFKDEEVLEMIKRTIRSQRGYWNDYDVDRYTVSLIPMKFYDDRERSINGRGLLNSFVTVGTNSKSLGLADLTYLYNHELMHHWFGQVLKQAVPEEAFKWFHEGFTDYFSYQTMLEGTLIDSSEYKTKINDIFAAYYSDSSHQWPNEKLQKDYWASSEMQKLPYQRGLIFALYLNESVLFHSQGKLSLKNIIQEMFAEARMSGNAFSVDRFLAILQNATKLDYTTQFDKFITRGAFISMDDWGKITGKIVLKAVDMFDLGFTTDRGIAMNAQIETISDGSNVQQAGLKVGDIMVGFSSTRQPGEMATIVVERPEGKVKYQFLPVRQVMVPQLK